MSDVESDKHENDQEERRPFFGSVRPKMDKSTPSYAGKFRWNIHAFHNSVLHACVTPVRAGSLHSSNKFLRLAIFVPIHVLGNLVYRGDAHVV